MASLTHLSGRKRESGIWEYFTYKADKDKSQCTVLDEKGSACGHEVSGKNATNLRAHVRIRHPSVYAEFEKEDAAKRQRGSAGTVTIMPPSHQSQTLVNCLNRSGK